jgi:hypothetical protein
MTSAQKTAVRCLEIAAAHIECGEFTHGGRYDCAEVIAEEIRKEFKLPAERAGHKDDTKLAVRPTRARKPDLWIEHAREAAAPVSARAPKHPNVKLKLPGGTEAAKVLDAALTKAPAKAPAPSGLSRVNDGPLRGIRRKG